MDPAQLENLYQLNRLQHTGRKTSRFPPPLSGDEGQLSEAQLLVRRGRDGLYIDACVKEDMFERMHAETFPHGYEYKQYQDKVRLIIRQTEEKVEDDEETLIGDTDEIEAETVPEPLEHPWWMQYYDPGQEDLTDTQARWLFKILSVIFLQCAVLICGLWPFLVSLGLCSVAYWQLNKFVWKQNYNWRHIDMEELRKQNPGVWMEYIRWGLTGARWIWTALRERMKK